MLRPSLLDPDVRVFVHPAPDTLSVRFCSCGCIGDMIDELPKGSLTSSHHDSRLHGAGVSIYEPQPAVSTSMLLPE